MLLVCICVYAAIITVGVGILTTLLREQEETIIKLESELDSLHTKFYESERIRNLHTLLDRRDFEKWNP